MPTIAVSSTVPSVHQSPIQLATVMKPAISIIGIPMKAISNKSVIPGSFTLFFDGCDPATDSGPLPSGAFVPNCQSYKWGLPPIVEEIAAKKRQTGARARTKET